MALAERLHRDQMRKASPIPYVSHLLAVAALTLEYGGDEDQAMAACCTMLRRTRAALRLWR